MKQLYIDCSMGAAGDMLSAALFELISDGDSVLEELNAFGIPNVKYTAEKSVKCGITGTHFHVSIYNREEHAADGDNHHDHDHEHEHHHEHHGLGEICNLISKLNAPENVKTNAKEVYTKIAMSEAKVHGKEMDNIHFHEVGTFDAVADVMAVCYLINKLEPDRVTVSPIRTGFGTVRCAHGILPVPAPATALLLDGMPVFPGDIEWEMCTPTGAALLKQFSSGFGQMPQMTVGAVGYGMGSKDFENRPNCVRAVLGETDESIVELKCNVDDMCPEDIGFAIEALLSGGAVDAWYEQIGMKKNRPAVILACLCHGEKRDEIVNLIFKHTTTIGIRETLCSRYILKRKEIVEETPFGPVRYKISEGYGVCRRKAEYDDLARISKKNDISILELRKMIQNEE